jgi:hypothetical protein
MIAMIITVINVPDGKMILPRQPLRIEVTFGGNARVAGTAKYREHRLPHVVDSVSARRFQRRLLRTPTLSVVLIIFIVASELLMMGRR